MEGYNMNQLFDGMSLTQSENDFILSILVPTQFVGLLIGKSGSCFRDLAKSTQCRLFLQAYEDIPELSRERVLGMNGSKQSVILALRKIIELIQPCTKSIGSQAGSCESQLDGSQIIKWVILQANCGNLIGRGGEGIKKINELSGAWVKVAHLEDSVRGAKERLVYIRGTPEQNIVALKIIIDKVGGWPFTTPVYDHEIAKIEEKTTLYIPFLAIPIILFGQRNFHGNLFPAKSDAILVIAGATVLVDANFLTSSAETQIHIVGPPNVREGAKDIIIDRLRNWLRNPDIGKSKSNGTSGSTTNSSSTPVSASNSSTFDWNIFKNSTKSSEQHEMDNVSESLNNDNDYQLFIPPQFSAQFANQFSMNDGMDFLNTSTTSLFSNKSVGAISRRDISENKEGRPPGFYTSTSNSTGNPQNISPSHSTNNYINSNNNGKNSNEVVSNSNYINTTSTLIKNSNNSTQPSESSSKNEILDCCVKIILTPEVIHYVRSMFQHIHNVTTCYLQILPSHNNVTKSLPVAQVSIIGNSLTNILLATELLIDYLSSLPVKCNPTIPYHVDKNKLSEINGNQCGGENNDIMTQTQKGFIQMLQKEQQLKRSINHSQDSVSSASNLSKSQSQNYQLHSSDNHGDIGSSDEYFVNCNCECFRCLLCYQKNPNPQQHMELDEFLKQNYPDILSQYMNWIYGKNNHYNNYNNNYHNNGHNHGPNMNSSRKNSSNLSGEQLSSVPYVSHSVHSSQSSYQNSQVKKSNDSIHSIYNSNSINNNNSKSASTSQSSVRMDRYNQLNNSNSSYNSMNNNNSQYNSSNHHQQATPNQVVVPSSPMKANSNSFVPKRSSEVQRTEKVFSTEEDPPLLSIPTLKTAGMSIFEDITSRISDTVRPKNTNDESNHHILYHI